MKKHVKKIIVFLLGAVLFVGAPFFIEAILLDETNFPFSMKIVFSREAWFSFIGSYLGAWGTIALGALAFLQNKRYKELSDEKDNEVKELQNQIKNLLQSNNDLTQGNKDIQESIREIIGKNTTYVESTNSLQQELKKLALSDSDLQKTIVELLEVNKEVSEKLLYIQKEIYYPRLHNVYEGVISSSAEGIEKIGIEEAVTYTFINTDFPGDDYKAYIKEHCGYIAVKFRNDGEKDIINFGCENIKLDKSFDQNIMVFWEPTDIKPHQCVRCVIAVERAMFNFFISALVNKPTEIKFLLNNSLGEPYILLGDITIHEWEDYKSVSISNLDMKLDENQKYE